MNGSTRSRRWAIALLLGGGFWIAACPGRAVAQSGREAIPSMRHLSAVQAMSEGEYRDALRTFLGERRGGIKTGQTAWIDSICYQAMAGECYYQMGQLPEAMAQYTDAIRLFIAYSNWMMAVQQSNPLRPGGPMPGRRQITWGVSGRGSTPGSFGTLMMGRGQLDQTDILQHGGVVQEPMLFPVNGAEIVRCTALAIRRRTELLGPTCKHDPLTDQLLTALRQPIAQPNHWTECWADLQRGLAEAAGGKDAQAVRSLERSLLAEGRFDHPLTCVALLELGKLAMAQNNLKAAVGYFLEASYSAAYFEDGGVLEEAFRLAAVAHMMQDNTKVFVPLVEAANWAGRNRYRNVRAAALMGLAEGNATLRQTRTAAAMLDEVRGLIGRRDMAAGRLGGQLAMLTALVRFQEGRVLEGNTALAGAMGYMSHGSHRLYQTRLTDELFLSQQISSRTAFDLFGEVLRDPTARDWTFDPAESLATLVVYHPEPLEHWFALAWSLQRKDQSLEIADRIRRHRYFGSLAFGGRLESLRWILEAPEESLDQASVLRRRDLLVHYPDYKKLQDQAAQIKTALDRMPLTPDDAKAAGNAKKLLTDLGKLGVQREAMLREIAVRREPADLVFPPFRTADAIRKGLPPGHAMLVFFVAQGQYYGFLLDQTNYDAWRIGPVGPVAKKVEETLREMGNHDANRAIPVKELASAAWRKPAKELLTGLLTGSKADFTAEFEELTVVPDGVLWYVPFEALQVDAKGESTSLLSRFRIRYSPTAGLGVYDGRRRRAGGKTGVALGKLYPKDKDEVSRRAFDELAKALPDAVAIPSALPVPSSLYRVLLDRLIVLDDLAAAGRGGACDWEPIRGGRGKAGNTLADWCVIPWGGPDVVILPGFHTPAETALRRVNPAAAGNDVFLSVCGLMSAGSRTLLLSRWRTGGQNSEALIREFAQELPHSSPSAAWQRSVLLGQESRLNLEAEPRVQPSKDAENLRADHPFFWAGYMLVDPGDPPGPAPKLPPVLKIVPKPADPPPPPAAPANPQVENPLNPPAAKP